jgi:hypothetical protein
MPLGALFPFRYSVPDTLRARASIANLHLACNALNISRLRLCRGSWAAWHIACGSSGCDTCAAFSNQGGNAVIRNLSRVLAVSVAFVALGCHGDKVTNVGGDPPPHRVDSVYSVTGDGEVTVYWRANQENDIDFYKVYRNNAATGTFHLVGSTPQVSFVDNTVVNGNTYFYALSAVDLAGQESAELSFENVFDTPRPEGFAVSLTNTFAVDSVSGWDFDTRTRHPSLDVATDMYYGAASGHFLVYVPADTKIQDAGYVALRDVDFGPPANAGWSTDGQVEAIVGHSYMVLTRDNNYAKFEVKSRNLTSMVLDWAYQTDTGNPELTRRAP